MRNLEVDGLRERREVWSQNEWAQAIFDSAVDGIVVTNAEGIIEMANSAFTAITGYLPEEVVGSKLERLLATESALTPGRYAAIAHSVQTMGYWRREIWGRRKDGSALLLWATITGLKDPDGCIQYYSVIFSDLGAQEELRLRYPITHDPVTGLPNRYYFMEQVHLLLGSASNSFRGYAILTLNVKGMKEINVLCGLASGDQVLKELAHRLTTCLSGRYVLGRWEGDEFVLFLPHEMTEQNILPILQIVQQVDNVVGLPIRAGGREIRVNLAIGVAVSQAADEEVADLIRAAEFAMDEATQEPGTAYRFYHPVMQEQIIERLTWEGRLRTALDRQEFRVYYQPQVHLKTGIVVGLEALVRWQHPELGLISPDKFIAVAEESGLIIPLGEEVLRQACVQAKTWLGQGMPLFYLAVNISAKQLRHPEFVVMVRRIVKETSLPPDMLVLEITESTAMQDVEFTQRTLNRLRHEGISFALDDFGTGYSSLNYLKKFPIEWLKIDRSFIKNIISSAQDAAIAKAIVQVAKDLHLKLIAEGVEEMDQMTLLKQLGCDIVQGYIVSPPLPPDGVEVLWQEQILEVFVKARQRLNR